MEGVGNLDYLAREFAREWVNRNGNPNIYIISKDVEARGHISRKIGEIIISEKRDARVFEQAESPCRQINNNYLIFLDYFLEKQKSGEHIIL